MDLDPYWRLIVAVLGLFAVLAGWATGLGGGDLLFKLFY